MRPIVVLLAALALVLQPGRAPAQGSGSSGFQIVDAKVEKGKFIWSESKAVPVAKVIEVTVNVNGVNVVEKRTVIEYAATTTTQGQDLKGLTATDANGKVIGADKLAELLKEPAPVVLVSGLISDKHRALFKDKTVFVELQLPKPPVPPAPPVDPN